VFRIGTSSVPVARNRLCNRLPVKPDFEPVNDLFPAHWMPRATSVLFAQPRGISASATFKLCPPNVPEP